MAAERNHGFLERWPYSRSVALGLGKESHAASLRDALGLPFHLEPSYLEPAYCHGYAGRFSYLAFPGHLGVCDYAFEPTFIRKRNERERQRVRCVNEGYARLREHLPREFEDKRLSKVETLRAAIGYIKHLQGLLGARAAHAHAGEPPRADCSISSSVSIGSSISISISSSSSSSDGESKHSLGFSDCGEAS